jgi:predicted house-cleaning noncanonical NTP pyrophosphatase (MazG superfamily)
MKLVRHRMTTVISLARPRTPDEGCIRPPGSKAEHRELLTQKLMEEVGKLLSATEMDDIQEGAGDVFEVLIAMVAGVRHVNRNFARDMLQDTADRKYDRWGGFTEGLVWDVQP